MQNLKEYSTSFDRGAPKFVEAVWLVTQALFVSSWIPGSFHRRVLLRFFGSEIGEQVVLKPRVRIKFPWKLSVGDFSWIGEGAWIDNLAPVEIGEHVCLSQDAYLCAGSHDWRKPTFDLIVEPIKIEDYAWVAARTTVGPGVTVGTGAVLALNSSTSKNLEPMTVYAGTPAKPIKIRIKQEERSDLTD